MVLSYEWQLGKRLKQPADTIQALYIAIVIDSIESACSSLPSWVWSFQSLTNFFAYTTHKGI